MNLSELAKSKTPGDLRQLAPNDYSLFWHSGFWDGPISGMLKHTEKEYWFEMFQENENPAPGQWYRRYAVVALTDEQLAKEHEVHEDFRRFVGTHSDYGKSDGKKESLKPKDQWHLFYDKHLEYCRSNRFGECEVIAWFET